MSALNLVTAILTDAMEVGAYDNFPQGGIDTINLRSNDDVILLSLGDGSLWRVSFELLKPATIPTIELDGEDEL